MDTEVVSSHLLANSAVVSILAHTSPPQVRVQLEDKHAVTAAGHTPSVTGVAN